MTVKVLKKSVCGKFLGANVLKFPDDCVSGATSSTREELDQFITSGNSFHPALNYTWEIFVTSSAFLDIKFV